MLLTKPISLIALCLSICLFDTHAFADDSIERLEKSIKSSNASTRRTAIDILATKGNAAESAIPKVISQLNDESLDVKISAIEFLGIVGTKNTEALEALAKLLSDKNPRLRNKAALALGKFGSPVVAHLRPLLIAKEVEPKEASLLTAGALGVTAAPLTREIERALDDEQVVIRRYAALALGQIGAKSAIPKMIQALHDGDSVVRQNLITALGQLGASSSQAVISLVEHLGDSDRLVHDLAISALSRLDANSLILPLSNALTSKNPAVREGAATLLGDLKQASVTAVSKLVAALDDETVEVRRAVVNALAKIDSPDSNEALIAALNDPDSAVRLTAAKTLGDRNVGAAAPALALKLEDENIQVAGYALRALAKLEDGASAQVPKISLILSGNPKITFAAKSALWSIGTKEAISALVAHAKKEKHFPECSKHTDCAPSQVSQLGMEIRHWTVFCDQQLCRLPDTLTEWNTACSGIKKDEDRSLCTTAAMSVAKDAPQEAAFDFCNSAHTDKLAAEQCRLSVCGYTRSYLQVDMGKEECVKAALSSSCEDKIKNGRETDIDCGGPDCASCELKYQCVLNSDCSTKVCDRGIRKECVKPCPDGLIKDNGPCGCRWRGETEVKVIDFKSILSKQANLQQQGLLHCCSGYAFWLDAGVSCP